MNPAKLVLLGLSVLAASTLPARAFILNPYPIETPVIEYYNTILDHYFLTIDYHETLAVDSGQAGPGWIRTGHAFRALTLPSSTAEICPNIGCGVSVTRFYGTPGLGPNSHFYTLVPAEVAALNQPGTGWTLEKLAFRLYAPSAGVCPTGTIPVFRLYNNRWMFNDSNHRYVTQDALRAQMVARGWVDEGVQLCSPGEAIVPVASYLMEGGVRVQAGESCGSVGPCVLVKGVPAPTAQLPWLQMTEAQRQQYSDRTGNSLLPLFVVPGSTPDDGYRQSFVQGLMTSVGIHLNTLGRTDAFSNVDAVYQLPTAASALEDRRLFPWRRDRDMETEFMLDMQVFVRFITLGSTNSAAYGHPSVEFRDARSGHSFSFNVVAYGTIPLTGDFAGPDARTGKPIVATSFRAGSPYLRSTGMDTLSTPPGRYDNNSKSAHFVYRMNREEFTRVLLAAHAVDVALSVEPEDYFVDNFRATNEVFGDGSLGVLVYAYSVSRVPRN